MDAIRVPLDLTGFEIIDSEVVNGRPEVEVAIRPNPRVPPLRVPRCRRSPAQPPTHPRPGVRLSDRAAVAPADVPVQRLPAHLQRAPPTDSRAKITTRFRKCLFERAVNEPFARRSRISRASDRISAENVRSSAPY